MSRRPLRVLYYVSNYHRFTGAQRSLHLLVKNLDRRLAEPLVVFPAEGHCTRMFRELGVAVRVEEPPAALIEFGGRLADPGNAERARLFATAVLPYSLRLFRLLRRERIDVAHFNDLRGVLIGGLGARMAGVPVVWHLRGVAIIGRLYMTLGSVLSDRIVLVARELLPLVPERFQGKCVTVHNGIEVAERVHGRERAQLLQELTPPLDLGQAGVVLVILASLTPQKGAHHLLEAARQLREADPVLSRRVGLVFVGDRCDEPYARKLDAIVAKAGLDNVRFAGWSPEPMEWIRAADAVVLPTVLRERIEIDGRDRDVGGGEGFPRSVLEAMACGRPVIASAVGGVVEQIDEGRTGLLVPPSDPGALAGAVARLARDPELRQRLGEAAARKVRERYTVARMVDGCLDVYQELLQ